MVKKVTKTEAAQVENTAVVEAPEAAPKAPAKKAPVKKAPAKAKKEDKAAKPEKAPKDKSGLSKPQVRVLQALAKAGKALDRKQLSSKAEIDGTLIGNTVGYLDPEINARPVHANNLVNRKFVKIETHDIDGKDVTTFTITASGKAALAKI
jgi:hypothetical protein